MGQHKNATHDMLNMSRVVIKPGELKSIRYKIHLFPVKKNEFLEICERIAREGVNSRNKEERKGKAKAILC
jgi:hypothetical protein